MFLDITLLIVFAVSLFLLWYRVSLKIPEVMAIPDEVITARLYEDSARLRLFILHIKTYYREEQYKPYLWNLLLKTIYRLHLILLRSDNAVVSYLKSIRARAEKEGIALEKINGSGERDTEYWQKLQSVTPPLGKHTRIEEVKKK